MILKEAIAFLKNAGVDSAEYDARELFKQFGNIKTSPVTLNASSNEAKLKEAIERRAKREPLQYIIGSVGFYREEYRVTSDCLIPRSDTEILVDYAVKHIPDGELFADLCAGSGCIGISTLANTNETRCVSVDISEKALQLTLENAKRNSVEDRISAVRANLLDDTIELNEKFFAILSNPPYISREVYHKLEKEIFHEPKIAFVAEQNGLEFYEKLTPFAINRLKPGGFIAFEIGYDQAEDIKSIADKNGCSCKIIKDYSGNDRVAVLEIIQ